MAGITDISGGRADYGYSSPSRSLFDDLAAKAMQTQEVPVASQMGYSMPSAPIIQDSPYAQYAWRTVPNLFGGLGVQPLMGFPSAYPHVLNGTPDSFLRWIPMLQSMMPPMQPLQWPQQKQGKTVQPMSPVSAAAQASTTTTPVRQTPTTVVAPPVNPPAPDYSAVNRAVEFVNKVPDMVAATSVAPQAPVYEVPLRSVTGENIGTQSGVYGISIPGILKWIKDAYAQQGPTPQNPYGM